MFPPREREPRCAVSRICKRATPTRWADRPRLARRSVDDGDVAGLDRVLSASRRRQTRGWRVKAPAPSEGRVEIHASRFKHGLVALACFYVTLLGWKVLQQPGETTTLGVAMIVTGIVCGIGMAMIGFSPKPVLVIDGRDHLSPAEFRPPPLARHHRHRFGARQLPPDRADHRLRQGGVGARARGTASPRGRLAADEPGADALSRRDGGLSDGADFHRHAGCPAG